MANFSPHEIEQILQQFFETTAKRQYVGARYVPIFGRKDESSINWDNSAPYEPLTIVLHLGNSYTSKKYVPAGVGIHNTDYWAETGAYNAQVEQYRQEVLGFDTRIRENRHDIETLESIIPADAFSGVNTVKAYIDAQNVAQSQALENELVPFPDSAHYPKLGTLGQVLTTLANGETKWENPVVPSDAQAEEVITAWLNEHPEATTTVQNNSLTTAKYINGSVTAQKTGSDVFSHRRLLSLNEDLYSLYNADSGWYGCNRNTAATLVNVPTDITESALELHVERYTYDGTRTTLRLFDVQKNGWLAILNNDGIVYQEWTKYTYSDLSAYVNTVNLIDGAITKAKLATSFSDKVFQKNSIIAENTDLFTLFNNPSGWYGFGAATAATLANVPEDFTNQPCRLLIETGSYAGWFTTLTLCDTLGNVWHTILREDGTTYSGWFRETAIPHDTKDLLRGKTVAIIGDSISTHGNSGTYCNVPEITITSDDVGVSLNAYLT